MIGHILRFDPRYVQAFHAAAPERLGAPIHLRAKRNGVRSTAKRLGRIELDPVLHGRPRRRRHAMDRAFEDHARLCAEGEVLGTGNEDALYAVVNFENGAIGNIDYSWAWPDGLMNGFRSSLEIVGTKSAAYLDCADQGFYVVEDGGTSGGDTHLWPEINGRIVGDLADELDHFIKATPVRQALSAALSRGVRRHPGARCAGAVGTNRMFPSKWCADRSALLREWLTAMARLCS